MRSAAAISQPIPSASIFVPCNGSLHLPSERPSTRCRCLAAAAQLLTLIRAIEARRDDIDRAADARRMLLRMPNGKRGGRLQDEKLDLRDGRHEAAADQNCLFAIAEALSETSPTG